ncbi:MAG: DUF1684 domain-containing protein [Acidobacteria bacterium]|nr:DUF1684 domain-containing protein [Acidobacteriota bacterium]
MRARREVFLAASALAIAAAFPGRALPADRAPWTGDPTKPQSAATAPAPADARAAIAERQRKRDQYFKGLRISPLTSLGVHTIDANKVTRAGADDDSIEIDPNTTKPDVVNILVNGSGVFATAVKGGGALRVRRQAPDGDVVPGDGEVLSGIRRIAAGEIVGMGRFFLLATGSAKGGQIALYDPNSPAHEAFTGFRWFPPDPALQIRAKLEPIAEPDKIGVATSDGAARDYYRFGIFRFTVDGKPLALTALAPAAKIGQGTTLFVPFRDATNGHETYANGRFLELKYEGPDSAHLLDFNRSINPYCNYSPWYSCPIPPKENTLDVAIRAGEMAYPHAD